ncbi:MAG: multicopper oxidase domain-containing protein [Candidatus Korobacteraceae bacterium]
MFRAVLLVLLCGISLVSASAQAPLCPNRPIPGDPLLNPLDLYSQNGVLTVNLLLQNMQDDNGFMHYCYIYMYQGQQIEAPTLRLNPGDTLVVNLTNNIQAPYGPKKPKKMEPMHESHQAKGPDDPCNDDNVLPSSTNIHFHGLNVPPLCHQDDVLHTVIQSGDPTFQYMTQIPANEPSGMYWYHPHIHGNTSTQVDGGATGAIIVEGNNPLTQGLNERIMILREQNKQGPARDPDANTQLTMNFEPAVFPEGGLAPQITMQAGAQEYWRFLNSSVKQFLSLQLTYGQTLQTFEILAIDGVQLSQPIFTDTLNIPPAGRMEFIVPGLPAGQTGTFMTNGYDTGPVGDHNNPQVLAKLSTGGTPHHPVQHTVKPPTQPQRFSGLRGLTPNTTRSLYFSEQNIGTNGGTQFYITVKGQVPKLFTMDEPPAIVTNTGAVEDWTIENHSGEVHAFHIHQIHFLVMAINGVPVPNPDLQDTIIVPNWSGSGPYPSVTLRMDFRDPNIAGTFVYHCHILDHEDGGMMAKIQVNPAN